MSKKLDILDDVVDPTDGDLKPELARYILSLSFSESGRQRYLKLSAKAQEGTLTAEEQADLDRLIEVNAFLMVIQSKARTSLKQSNPAA